MRRFDNEKGRFTLVFLNAIEDVELGQATEHRRGSAQVELTYNWPEDGTEAEIYTGGRNFGHLA